MIVRPLQFNVFLYLLSLKIYRKQYILDLRTRLDGQFQKHRLGAPLPPPPQTSKIHGGEPPFWTK